MSEVAAKIAPVYKSTEYVPGEGWVMREGGQTVGFTYPAKGSSGGESENNQRILLGPVGYRAYQTGLAQKIAAALREKESKAQGIVDEKGEPLQSAASAPNQDNEPMAADLTRDEMKATIAASQGELRAEWAEFRSDMRGSLDGIRLEMANLRSDLVKELGHMQEATNTKLVAQTRWIIGILVTVVGVGLGVFLKTPSTPSSAAKDQPPVVNNYYGYGQPAAVAPASATASPPATPASPPQTQK